MAKKLVGDDWTLLDAAKVVLSREVPGRAGTDAAVFVWLHDRDGTPEKLVAARAIVHVGISAPGVEVWECHRYIYLHAPENSVRKWLAAEDLVSLAWDETPEVLAVREQAQRYLDTHDVSAADDAESADEAQVAGEPAGQNDG